WRKGDRWGTRVRLGCVAQLHATGHEHRQFFRRVAISPRRRIHRVTRWHCGAGVDVLQPVVTVVVEPGVPSDARLGGVTRPFMLSSLVDLGASGLALLMAHFKRSAPTTAESEWSGTTNARAGDDAVAASTRPTTRRGRAARVAGPKPVRART